MSLKSVYGINISFRKILMERRPRNMTEKGLAYNLHILRTRQISSLSAATRRKNHLIGLMQNPINLHVVQGGSVTYEELVVAYEEAHNAYINGLHEDADKAREVSRFKDNQREIAEFRQRMTEWLQDTEQAMSLKTSKPATALGKPHSTKRHSSRGSSSGYPPESSIRSHHAREKAKLAELLAEKSMAKQRQALADLQLDIEIAKARARERAFADEDSQCATSEVGVSLTAGSTDSESVANVSPSTSTNNTQRDIQPTSTPAPGQTPAPVSRSAPEVSDVSSVSRVSAADYMTSRSRHTHAEVAHRTPTAGQLPVAFSASYIAPTAAALDPAAPAFQPTTPPAPPGQLDALQQLTTALALPQPEVPKFSGDPIEYNSFIRAFDTRIASRTANKADMLYYLDQYLVGEPKDLIGGCMFMSNDTGYAEARYLLDNEYGDEHKIATAYVDKALSWPVVKADDNQGLKCMSVFLTKCLSAMKCISHMNVMNHAPNLHALVQKLPPYLQNKWRDCVNRLRRQEHTVANFGNLVEFLKRAADTANDPVFSKEALGMSDRRSNVKPTTKPGVKEKKVKGKSFVTEVCTSTTSPRVKSLSVSGRCPV